MLAPAKRPAPHPPDSPSLPSPNPTIPDHLADRLRSLGSRIRKHVTEGYATPPSHNSSPSKSPFIFQSAKDTLRDVYLSQSATPSSSPRKRPRSDSEQNDDTSLDSDMDADDELPSFASDPQAQRPIKALRKRSGQPNSSLLAVLPPPPSSSAK